MTPAARVAAAIEVLDLILDGSTPEKALTGWGRTHRFAGSKDRAAIRDHVFQALRCRASYAWRGGKMSGRGIMLGAMSAAGLVEAMFTGEGHAPAPLSVDEHLRDPENATRADRCDIPEWLLPHFDRAFGDDADDVMVQLRERAGVFLRVNAMKASRAEAAAILAEDGIATEFTQDISTGLQVVENERRIAQSKAYLDGIVELQDTSSQMAIQTLGITPGIRVLDYCAGGGGKSLAMAALGASVTAHDIDPRRMVDLVPRSRRAGVEVATVETVDLVNLEKFDLVLCDAPCSGSGTWRRTPAAKWDLTSERLHSLTKMQDDVLSSASAFVAESGRLAYATCSALKVENSERVDAFVGAGWVAETALQLAPTAAHDGFFLATLMRH